MGEGSVVSARTLQTGNREVRALNLGTAAEGEEVGPPGRLEGRGL